MGRAATISMKLTQLALHLISCYSNLAQEQAPVADLAGLNMVRGLTDREEQYHTPPTREGERSFAAP